ncbi:MAG: class I adenylate-forming enzyme family protein [Acutalibacteraceae bacterium]|nr:class I adenylate-forming enzyme family protein [Acutalibacteraceae bacterium]
MKRTFNIWSEHHSKDNFIAEYPDCSMFTCVQKTAEKYPDYVALEFQDKKTTYSEMISQIELIAQALLANGVKKGDYVSVVAPNTPQALNMVYAVNRIGAISNMIHPLLSASEIKKFVENVDSVAVLTFDLLYQKIANIEWETQYKPLMIIARIADALPFCIKPFYLMKNKLKISFNPNHEIIYWNDFLKKGKSRKETLAPDNGKGEDVAVILYSGGTTGLPKGVMLQNQAFNALAVQSTEIGALDVKDRAGKKALGLMPAFHGFGLGVCMHMTLAEGGHLCLVPKFDYIACAKLIFKKKINHIYAVPALYEALCRSEEIEKSDLSFIEMVVISGEKCDKKLIKRMNKYLEKGNSKARMLEAYGQTESVAGIAINPFFAIKEDSAGIPYPDNEIKIVKIGTHETLPAWEDGEICVFSPTQMKGYYKNEAETAHALQKHADGKIWLHTGDIGCMDEEGYLYFRQRYSRMIIVAGYNVYPTQIENIINKCENVNTSCVIGVTGRVSGQKIVAVVQPTNMNADLKLLKKEILKVCEENIADYAMPQEIVFREEMPKTTMGKVNFKALTEEYSNRKGE